MANQNAVRGFSPIGLLQGGAIPVRQFGVDSSNGTAIYVGDLVSAENDGKIAVSSADDGVIVLGSVVGIYDSLGNPIDSPNSTTSTPYLAASTAGYVDVALMVPGALFQVESASAAVTDVFASANHVAGTGSTVTGVSGHYLDSATTGAANFIILDKVNEPNNAWGANVDLVVTTAESFFMAAGAGV